MKTKNADFIEILQKIPFCAFCTKKVVLIATNNQHNQLQAVATRG